MFWDGVGFVSALGDRIVGDGPFVAGGVQPSWLVEIHAAAEWNGLRQELIELRARAVCPRPEAHMAAEWRGEWPPQTDAALRSCPICANVMIGPDLAECTACAGREDAAAKRAADL